MTAITLTLLFCSLGAVSMVPLKLSLFKPFSQVIFGMLSDRFGRKWPLVFNLVLIAILELGAGFVQTFSQFLALRSLWNWNRRHLGSGSSYRPRKSSR